MISREDIKDIASEARNDGEQYAYCDGIIAGAELVINSIGSCSECKYIFQIPIDMKYMCLLTRRDKELNGFCDSFERIEDDKQRRST